MSSRARQSLQLGHKLELTGVYPFLPKKFFWKKSTHKALPGDTEKNCLPRLGGFSQIRSPYVFNSIGVAVRVLFYSTNVPGYFTNFLSNILLGGIVERLERLKNVRKLAHTASQTVENLWGDKKKKEKKKKKKEEKLLL